MTPPPTDRDQALRDALLDVIRQLDDPYDGDPAENERLMAEQVKRLMPIYEALAMQEPASEPADEFQTCRDATQAHVRKQLEDKPASEPAPCGDPARYAQGDCLGPECPICEPASEPAPASAPSCCGEDDDGLTPEREIAALGRIIDRLRKELETSERPCRCGELPRWNDLPQDTRSELIEIAGCSGDHDCAGDLALTFYNALRKPLAATAPRSGESHE